MTIFLYSLLAAYVVISVIVTRSLILDHALGRKQKLMQLLIVWLVPIIGGCVVLVVQGQGYSRTEMKSLVPFLFHLVGNVDRKANTFRSMHELDGTWLHDNSIGKGASNSD